MRSLVLLAALGALACGAASAKAAPGDLDTAFAARALPALAEPGSGVVTAMAVRPDGRIVTASLNYRLDGTDTIVVHQLLPDGGRDPSFDGDGVTEIDTHLRDEVLALAVQPDGKIVLAGAASSATTTRDVSVFRLKADGGDGKLNGALDPTFDQDGAAGIGTDSHEESAAGIALLDDGRIVVAGTRRTATGGGGDFAVWRLKAGGGEGARNGSLDASFDQDGAAVVDAGNDDRASAVDLRRDGSMVVAGSSTIGAVRRAVVAVLRPGGGVGQINDALDSSFDGNGLAELQFRDASAVSSVALDADERILLGGHARTFDLSAYDAVVWRLNADGGTGEFNGAVDRTFGRDGVAVVDAGARDEAKALGLQGDGSVVGAGGSEDAAGEEDAVAFRLAADGTPDRGFGTGGLTVVDRSPADDARAVAVDARGDVLVAGSYVIGSVVQRSVDRLDGTATAVTAPPPERPGAAAPGAPGARPSGAPAPKRVTAPRARRFGARTRVTARLRGRRLRVANANAFPVRVRIVRPGARPIALTVRARGTRTVRLSRRRGLRVTVTDPAGATRMLAARELRQLPHDHRPGRS